MPTLRADVRQADRLLSGIIQQIRKTGRPVEEYHAQLESWERDLIDELNAAVVAGTIDETLRALVKMPAYGKKLVPILAMVAEAEQESLHPDFRIGKQGKQVFATLSEDDIEQFPDPEWQIAGILQTSTVSLIFGPSGTGKTFLGLDIAGHVARGMNWLGRRVKQSNVLYVFAEGKYGLKPRILAWRKHHEQNTSPNIRFIARPVQLVNDRQMLLDTVAEQEVTPALIVIDTFSNCAVGMNQNDRADVFKVLSTAHDLVREHGCHVMIVHHTNRQDMVNGSAAFKNHVDTMVSLSRASEDAPIIVHCEKQRDAEPFEDITLQLQVIQLYTDPETLEQVNSCAVIAGTATTTQKVTTQVERRMLDVLTSLGRTSYNAWRKKCQDAKIVKATSFYGYVSRLVDNNRVRKDAEGPGRRTWYEVVQETSSSSS
jgi:hypothetical protein